MSDAHAQALVKKDEGNAAFKNKQWAEAERKYTEGIELDDTIHILFGNRAAARISLNKHEEALADAQRAVQLNETYGKGYHRIAQASLALERPVEAFRAYVRGNEVAPSAFFADSIEKTRRQVIAVYRTQQPTSVEEWFEIFETLNDSRERMSTMAHFWNLATPGQRWAFFQQFLSVVGGETASAAETITMDLMLPLPMENYRDLTPVQPWMDFFSALTGDEDRLAVMQGMYERASEPERNVIVNDLKTFFGAGPEANPFLQKLMRDNGLEVPGVDLEAEENGT